MSTLENYLYRLYDGSHDVFAFETEIEKFEGLLEPRYVACNEYNSSARQRFEKSRIWREMKETGTIEKFRTEIIIDEVSLARDIRLQMIGRRQILSWMSDCDVN